MASRARPAWGLALALVVPAAAGFAPPELPVEHVHPSEAFVFRTPADWKVRPGPRPEVFEAYAGDLLVRFLYRDSESGYDSLHVSCMAERLSDPMAAEPRVKYDYDFIGGVVAARRALDSAFVVRYDPPVRGHRDWRQRNLTLVGQGQSLCVIVFVPAKTWKKSRPTRALLDGVLASLRFR